MMLAVTAIDIMRSVAMTGETAFDFKYLSQFPSSLPENPLLDSSGGDPFLACHHTINSNHFDRLHTAISYLRNDRGFIVEGKRHSITRDNEVPIGR
jgi:hypothetical protein